MAGTARKPSASASASQTHNHQPSSGSSTTPRHPRQRSKSATTTNDDDKYAPHRRTSLAVDSSSRPSTPASASVSRTASPAPATHTPTATRRQQPQPTLRPPGSAEYRYSIGPAPVRFPKSPQKEEEQQGGESSKQAATLPSQLQSQGQQAPRDVTSAAATPARPRIIKRPSSKVLTTFPFPHPTTPGHEDGSGGAGEHSKRLGFGWVGRLFGRQTDDGDVGAQHDVEAQHQHSHAQSEHAPLLISSSSRPNSYYSYGTAQPPSPSPRPTHPRHSASSDSLPDPSDPYGYRRLAGPQLLPEYHSNRAARRRTRTRIRQGWFDRQRRMTTVFTILCLVALAASTLGWWVARGEDLRGKIPKRRGVS